MASTTHTEAEVNSLRDWWRTRTLANNLRDSLRYLSFAALFALMAFAAVAIAIDIAHKWHEGTLVDGLIEALSKKTVSWILIGLFVAFVAVVIVLWVISILWAWVTLPLTLRDGVAALNGLRLEVRRLRRRMFPVPPAPDDDVDDLNG